MTATPTLNNRITARNLAAKILPYGQIPLIIRVTQNESEKDFRLDSAQTSLDGKPGTDTDYGCIDVYRVEIDNTITPSGIPVTAMQFANEIKMDTPVKLLAEDGDICFLLGDDLQISRRQGSEGPECVVTVTDTDDA